MSIIFILNLGPLISFANSSQIIMKMIGLINGENNKF